jgi:hypothetical protein
MAEIGQMIKTATLSDINAPLQKIKNALDPMKEVDGVSTSFPVTFEGLEQLRRFLRDRSYGLPAEGYDAIGQQQAGRLADIVEGIQKEFSPGISKFLEQYRKDSEPLRAFKTKLGKSIVETEDFDMARFATDPATIGSKFFKSETSVKDLINLLGDNAPQAEKIARGYVSDQLRSANSKQILQKINDWRDWLPQFKGLENELKSAAERMAQSERIGGRRETLASDLRKEAKRIPESVAGRLETAAGREASGIISGAEAQATASGKAVERQKGRIETEAERAGQKAMTEAEREATKLRGQAGKLSAEGEQIRKQILGDAFPADRIQQLIMQGKPSLWQEVGPIIASDPKAKKAFGDALGQVMADAVVRSPRAAVEAFDLRIRPAMESTGLLSARQLANLQAEINRINQTVEGPQKTKLLTRLITNAVTGEAARGLSYITNPFDTMSTILGK